jgi:signal transduction histidine kinase
MMQSVDLALTAVLVLAFITLYGTVAWGLFRYSAKQSFRYWALGWVIYSIGGLQAGFSSFEGLVPYDLFGLVCIFIGASLILVGSRGSELTRKQVRNIAVSTIVILMSGVASLVLEIPYYVVFGFLGMYVAGACLISVRAVQGIKDVTDISKGWLMAGLAVWALSWIIFPLVAIMQFYFYFLIIQSAGVIITGSAMLTLFTSTVTRNLEHQYQVSQIMSSLIQHDIRNYIQVAKSAIELTEGTSVVENHWIGIATDSLNDAAAFINEMRDITSVLYRQGNALVPTTLASIISDISDRVQMEYSLRPEQIQVQIQESCLVQSSPLVKEILWNIFDNAFKHGSPVLHVRTMPSAESNTILEISDRSGGLSQELKDFLNSPESLSRPVPPGLGIGVVLIRGLAIICGIDLCVEDIIQDSSVIGTKYILGFKK